MPLPKKNRDCARELQAAWHEALSIFQENGGTAEQQPLIYRMAPTLAIYQRGMEQSLDIAQLTQKTLSGLQSPPHGSISDAEGIKHRFINAYLLTHLHARLISQSKLDELLAYVQHKGLLSPPEPIH